MITGAPAPLSETAPIQLHGFPAAVSGATWKLIAVSAGGGVKVGEGSSRKWVKGVASFPAVGWITLRLCRKSGTRINELRRKAMRTAAARGSGPAAAACKAIHCCCTSGGQVAARALRCATTECRVCASPRFAATRPSSSKSRWIVRLCGENLLQQLLKFGLAVGVALPLNFLRQQIHGAQITGVDLHRLAELDDSLRRIAAFAFEHT